MGVTVVVEALAVALHGEMHGPVGALHFLQADILPGGIGLAIQLDDPVAILNPALAAGEPGITWPITACRSVSATF